MWEIFAAAVDVSFAWLLWSSSDKNDVPEQQFRHGAPAISALSEIPGESPFRYCAESRASDLLSIDMIQVVPNPPVLEENLSIHVYGSFLKNISANATVYGWYENETWGQNVTGSGTSLFCDTMDRIEQPGPPRNQSEACPPQKGGTIISIYAWMDWWIGYGNFSVKFDAKDDDEERIYCLEADFCLGFKDNKDKRGDTYILC